MDIKKIIAREGLIIIGIAMLLAALLFINEREQSGKYQYEQKSEILEIAEVTHPNKGKQKTSSGAEYELKEIIDPTGIYVMIPKGTDYSILEAAVKKDFPHLKDPKFVTEDFIPSYDDQGNRLENYEIDKLNIKKNQVNVQRYYDEHGKHKRFIRYDEIILVVIFLYPAYLIIRFIYLAIRTLQR